VRHNPSKPTIVQELQSQQTHSSWAFTESRPLEHNRLAVFCRGDVSRRGNSGHCNNKRPIPEDGANEGDTEARTEACANDKGISGTNEPENPGKACSQGQSSTNSGGIDTQRVQSDQNRNGTDNRGHDNKAKAANDADQVKICRLIEKIELSVKHNHNERTRTRIQNLWEKTDYLTLAQWAFDSLLDLEANDPLRRVFLKLSLYQNLNKRIKQGALLGHTSSRFKTKYKEDMMQESRSFRRGDGGLQVKKRRAFNNYVQQGAVIDKLCSLCAGLVALVAPILTETEYGLWFILVNLLIFSPGL